MSLRARVLVGMAAIAVVLGAAALVITQIIESHLVHQVDQQLAKASGSFERNLDLGTVCLTRFGPDAAPVDGGIDVNGDGVADVPLPDDPATGLTETPSSAPSTGGGASTSDPPATATSLPGDPAAAGTVPPGDAPEEGSTSPTEDRILAACTGMTPPTGIDRRAAGLLGRLSTIDVGIVTTSDQGGDGTDEATFHPVIPEDPSDSAETTDAAAEPRPAIDAEEVWASAGEGEPFTTGSEGPGPRHRVQAVVNADTGWVVAVSQPLESVDATVGRLVAVEVVATAAILGVLGLVAWWVIRHGVRPVKQMTATASAIAGGDLSHRVPEHDPDTEAGQLGTALNRMLGRIEHAFDERSRSEARLRQFVADASHELRTPVTTIRGYSELYETGGLEDDVELSEAMRRTRQEAVRMGNLVDDMLLLARLDEGRELAREPVDVAALVRDAGRDARAVDPDRSVVTATQGPLVVLGDADRLRQVVANLVGNALVHTPSSARLDLRARRDGDRAVVEVADRGPGMPPEVLAQAFDRFFRADPSRSRHRGGSGLGLAIVQATAAAHGGEVSLHSTQGEGTTARLTLPLAPTDD